MERISFERLIEKMVSMPEVIEAAVKPMLTQAAVKVQKTAQEKFGDYQPAIGPFEGWALLTLETLHRKLDLAGAAGPDPLIGHYAKGKENRVYPISLRQSITIQVDEMSAYVGTNDPLGRHHEYGAPRRKIPPRPFLRPALYQNQDWIKRSASEAVGLGMVKWF